MRPPYVSKLSSDKKVFETQTRTDCAKPGLAYTGPQLDILARTGRLNVPERQPLYEPYTIDKPNPMRAPNCDISDARKYTESLAEDYKRATIQLETLKKQKSKIDVKKNVSSAAGPETQASGSGL